MEGQSEAEARGSVCEGDGFVLLQGLDSSARQIDPIVADFFLSGGLNCTPALQLRRNKLRICSSPLDWMMHYRLADAVELYKTGFAHFFEDITEHPYDHPRTRRVEDLRNGMVSIHHFPVAMSLADGQRYYRDRAARHFENTHRFLSGSSRYALVIKSGESLDDIAAFADAMNSLYPGAIVINVRQGLERSLRTIASPGSVTIHDFTFDDITVLDKQGIKGRPHWGNDYEWGRVLRRCKRTKKFAPPEKMGSENYN